MNTREIKIHDYSYYLSDERIAKYPISRRDQSKLLVYRHGEIGEDLFFNLPEYLPENSLMVFNNTRVIQARLHFRKETGASIEVFLLEPVSPADYEQVFLTNGHCEWKCLIGNMKKWKEGTLQREITVNGHSFSFRAIRRTEQTDSPHVAFDWDQPQVSFAEILESLGELPIPPYLNRDTQESDKTTYQTVYSKIKGSVAAPTAGLHFTDEVLQAIDKRHILREEVTLHVGAGTFKPVKSEQIANHEMHSEHICVHRHTIEQLIAHQAKAIAVGTTSVRTLESLYYIGCKIALNPNVSEEQLHVNQWEPYNTPGTDVSAISPMESLQHILRWLDMNGLEALHTSTQIIIAPGYDYKIVHMLITNFHQPQSTLLLLVSAFVKGDWKRIYDYALTHDFRFLSYGDSSLLIP